MVENRFHRRPEAVDLEKYDRLAMVPELNPGERLERFFECPESSRRDDERIGQLTRKRLQEQIDTLVELKLLGAPLPLEKFVSFDTLPADLKRQVEQELASGRYQSPDELIEQALRQFLDERQRGQRRLEALRRIGQAVDQAGLYGRVLITSQE